MKSNFFPFSSCITTLRGLDLLSSRLSQELISPTAIALWGDLGCGKTTFSRFFIQNFLNDKKVKVPSPTFTLVQTYEGKKGSIVHADLYRVKSIQEIEELGILENFLTSFCLIEWPQRLGPYLPSARIDITFSILSQTERRVTIDQKK